MAMCLYVDVRLASGFVCSSSACPVCDVYSVVLLLLFFLLFGLLQMLPHTPWVDSSPSKGTIRLPAAPSAHHSTTTQPQQHSTPHHDTTGTSAAQGSITSVTQPGGGKDSVLKRWGNTNDPAFGDIHFYNYVDDCQVCGWGLGLGFSKSKREIRVWHGVVCQDRCLPCAMRLCSAAS